RRRLFGQLGRLQRGVEVVAVDLLEGRAIYLAVLAHSCIQSMCWVVVDVGPELALPRAIFNCRTAYSTVIPNDRAVPAMILAAASMSLALRSAFFVSAISRTWSQVTLATFSLCGSGEPLATLAALSSRRAAGGVFSAKVKLRSS